MKKLYTILITLLFIVSLQSLLSAQESQITHSNWHRVHHPESYGASTYNAINFLDSIGKKGSRVVVAIVGTGVDTTNKYINNSIKREGKIVGWNFLGDSNNTINPESIGKESFRVMQKYHNRYSQYYEMDSIELRNKLTEGEFAEFVIYRAARLNAKVDMYISFTQMQEQIYEGFKYLDSVIISQKDSRDIPFSDLATIDYSMIPDSMESTLEMVGGECQKAMFKGAKTWREAYESSKAEYELSKERLNTLGDLNSNPRFLIGDDPNNFDNLKYGNNNVMCSLYERSTALASILVSNNNIVEGIYNKIDIMPIRVVSAGDPFDKDIFSSILFAVDAGAHVILLPPLKEFYTHKSKLTQALEYAKKRDVLVIIPAGEFYTELSLNNTFIDNGMSNVITVSNCDIMGVKPYKSNYGSAVVDVFAAGCDIHSIDSQGKISGITGTDVSGAVVAGVCAIVKSYFPKLTASQIKEAIIKGSKQMPAAEYKSSSEVIKITSQTMSKSAGAVNALNTVKSLL